MLELTDEFFMGKGAHKETFIDPRDNSKCIKFLIHEPDIDWEREQAYRQTREKRHLSSTLLTKYYGTVETNLGTGYVFERVVDYDGKNSRNFQEFLEMLMQQEDREQAKALLRRVLLDFREKFFAENVVTTNMEYANFMVQQHAPDYEQFSVRIIDNIGSHVLIPLLFWIDFLALRHNQRYWQRFITDIQHDYPELLPAEL